MQMIRPSATTITTSKTFGFLVQTKYTQIPRGTGRGILTSHSYFPHELSQNREKNNRACIMILIQLNFWLCLSFNDKWK